MYVSELDTGDLDFWGYHGVEYESIVEAENVVRVLCERAYAAARAYLVDIDRNGESMGTMDGLQEHTLRH